MPEFSFLCVLISTPKSLRYCIIGERSEPPSDKLGGEICIATRVLVCIYLYIYIYAYGLTTVPCPRYMLRAQRGQLINIILRSPFNVLHSVLVIIMMVCVVTSDMANADENIASLVSFFNQHTYKTIYSVTRKCIGKQAELK